MSHHPHHLIANILHLLAGGGLGLLAASLCLTFGMRSADRMPGESRFPHCAWCFRPLTGQEALPLIGWLLRPGTFSFPCPCGLRKKLWQQPVAELMGFLLGILAMYLQDWSLTAVPLCLVMGLLPALALVDLHYGIIPDGHNLLLGILGIIFLELSGADLYLGVAVAGALLGLGLFLALVYSKWRGIEMLGLGDVKFFAAAGFWLHPHSAPWFLGLGGLIGVLFSLLHRSKDGSKQFPFAPALCAALVFIILYQIIDAP